MTIFSINLNAGVAATPTLIKASSRVLAVLQGKPNMVVDPSFEYDTVGAVPSTYTAVSGGVSSAGADNLQVGTGWAASPGTKAVHLNATLLAGSPTYNGLSANASQPVVVGQPYIASAMVYAPSGVMAASTYFVLRIAWLNAAGGVVSNADSFTQIGHNDGHGSITNGSRFTFIMDWSVPSAPTAPAGAVAARVEFYAQNWDSTAAHLMDLWVDQLSLTAGSTFPGYNDGDNPNWMWAGVPGNSVSINPNMKGSMAKSESKVLSANLAQSGIVNHRRYPILVSPLTEGAALRVGRARFINVTVGEQPTLLKASYARLAGSVTEGAVIVIMKHISFSLSTSLNENVVLTLARAVHLIAGSVTERATALGLVVGKQLTARVVEIGGLNKKGKYKSPPDVLELYDLIDPYTLPNLKGATVSYVHGLFGPGVMFDIYAAYVNAGGAFFVCDNGLKQALDQHPTVARVF